MDRLLEDIRYEDQVYGLKEEGGLYHTEICERKPDSALRMSRDTAERVWKKEACRLCVADDFGYPEQLI